MDLTDHVCPPVLSPQLAELMADTATKNPDLRALFIVDQMVRALLLAYCDAGKVTFWNLQAPYSSEGEARQAARDMARSLGINGAQMACITIDQAGLFRGLSRLN